MNKRIIPILLLNNESLIKTKQFGRYDYIGDPANTVRIFNELEVDELFFLDIFASRDDRSPNFKILNEIANECFMPLGYGGGISNIDQAKEIFKIGFEKVSINSAAIQNPSLITELSETFGSQAVIVSIDYKKNIFGRNKVLSSFARGLDPIVWAQEVERRGAGEIMLTCVDKEGTWDGYDLEYMNLVSESVSVPVIGHGGCGSVEDVEGLRRTTVSAVGIGSMLIFQKKNFGVLVNYPDELKENE